MSIPSSIIYCSKNPYLLFCARNFFSNCLAFLNELNFSLMIHSCFSLQVFKM